MTRMAIVGTVALGVGALVALFATQCAHADTGIRYQSDALGRQVPAQTVFPARESQAGKLSKAQAEPNNSEAKAIRAKRSAGTGRVLAEAKAQFRIDGLGRKVPNQTTSPWVERARRALNTVPSMIQSEAEADSAGIRYHTDSLGRKVSNRTLVPLG